MAWHSDRRGPGERREGAAPRAPRIGDEVPRWLLVSGAIAVLLALLVLVHYAIDVAAIVVLVAVFVGAVHAVSDWVGHSDSASGWALGSVALGIGGLLLIGFWLFGDTRAMPPGFRRDAAVALSDALNWAEAHGWGRRALVPGGAIDRAVAADRGPGDGEVAPASMPGAGEPGGAPDGRATGSTKTGPRSSPAAISAESSPGRVATGRGGGAIVTEAVATRTTVEVQPSRVPAAADVRITATVAPARDGTLPTGVVVFRRDDVVMGEADLQSQGGRARAVIVTRQLPVGTHAITAEFTAEGRWQGSRSESVMLQVVR